MTPTHNRTHVLTRYKLPLVRSIQAGLIASTVALSAAPSQAATITKVFSGFTEAFAPAYWTLNTAAGGTASFTGTTTLTLERPVNQGSTPAVTYLIDSSVLEAFRPAKANTFLSGFFTYDYSWSTGSGASATPRYNFAAIENFMVVAKLNPSSGTTPVSGSNTSSTLSGFENFGFVHTKVGNTGTAGTFATGTISNFVFTATYSEVPGPLPLAGAAAGFAWSRRLRRRLKTAQASL